MKQACKMFMNNNQYTIIIGGGPAGLEAANLLGKAGYKVTLFEKEVQTGGKLNLWFKLFPGLRPAQEIKEHLISELIAVKPEIISNAEVINITPDNNHHTVTLSDGRIFKSDVVLISTGFDLFKAEKKEEYGYTIYDNVITSADLEKMLRSGNAIRTKNGEIPTNIGLIHCVGSRDAKAGNIYCSRLCCITGVKQAIEIKHHLPDSQIYNFYMDLRMFGQNFEETYIEAQQKWGITFIRGRVSEIGENHDGTLQLKAEDTLSGRPIKMKFDLIVLLTGMQSAAQTVKMARSAGLDFNSGNFLACSDTQLNPNETNIPGLFVAGTCKEPLSIAETLSDARSAALKIISWFQQQNENELLKMNH